MVDEGKKEESSSSSHSSTTPNGNDATSSVEGSTNRQKLVLRVQDEDEDDWADDFSWGDEASLEASEEVEDLLISSNVSYPATMSVSQPTLKPKQVEYNRSSWDELFLLRVFVISARDVLHFHLIFHLYSSRAWNIEAFSLRFRSHQCEIWEVFSFVLLSQTFFSYLHLPHN